MPRQAKKNFHIPYNQTIAALINDIGMFIEGNLLAFTQTLPLPLPLPLLTPNLRITWQGSGDFNVSLILELALLKTAWDIRTIPAEDLKRYIQFYVDNRDNEKNRGGRDVAHAGRRFVEMNPSMEDATKTITHFIDANVVKIGRKNNRDSRLGKAGEVPPNYSASSIIALCYAHEIVERVKQ